MRDRHATMEVVNKRRWKMYAAAAAATVAAGGAENVAEAQIFYSGVINTPVTNTIIPVAGLGSAPPVIGYAAHDFGAAGGNGRAFFGVFGQVAGFGSGAFLYASKLAYGQQISVLANFTPPSYFNTLAWGNGYTNSQFLAPGQGYMAFRFNAGTQFGWARVTMAGAPNNSFVLNDYAYGSVGQAVRVGQTFAPVPEPATSLGALALGAMGVMAWRRARQAAKPAV